MADEFRGLTIRLGADSRPLKQAISSIQRSASQANKQLTAMKKALQFDGGNKDALALAIDLAGEKAQLTAKSVVKIDAAMKQVSEETQRTAKSTESAYLKAQKLREAYTGVDAQLQHVYDAMAKVVEESEGWDTQKAVDHVKDLRDEMFKAKGATEETKKEFDELIKKASEAGAGKRFGLEKEQVKELKAKVFELKEEHKKLNAEYGKAKAVEGYKAMETQLVSWRSELRKAAAEIVDFNVKMSMLGDKDSGLVELDAKLKRIENGLDEARQSANRMNQAFEKAPESLEAATAKVKAYKAQFESANDKVKALESKIKELMRLDGFDAKMLSSGNVYGEFERAATAAEKAKAELDEANAKVKMWEDLLEKAGGKAKVAFGETEMAVDKVEKELEEARLAAKRFGEDYAKASHELNSAAVTKGIHQAKEELVEARVEAQRFGKEMRDATSIFGRGIAGTARRAGYGAYTTVTPAFTMAARYSIEAAKDIDSAYRDMRKTVDGTEEQFEHLKKAAIDFSLTHVTSAEQILEIESIGGQLGIQVENLEGFAKTVSNLEIATNMDAEQIAENLGQLSFIMEDMRDKPETLDKFADALVRLGNNSATQEDRIMNVMMRIASMGTIMDMSTNDLLALSTAVAAGGQGAEAAGTAISRTFSNIESAVSGPQMAMQKFGEAAAENGEDMEAYQEELEACSAKLNDIAKVAGMTAEEFSAMWNSDDPEKVMDAFQAFIEGLKRIDEAGGSVDGTLKSLGMNSVRQKQTIETLMTTADKLNEFRGMSSDAWFNDTGDAMREAEQKSEGFSGALGKLSNAAKALGEAFAEGCTPILQAAAEVLKLLASAVGGLPGPVKSIIAAFGGLLAAAGPLAVAFGAIIDGVGTVKDKFSGRSSLKLALKETSDGMALFAEGVEDAGKSAEKGASRTDKLKNGLKNFGKALAAGVVVAGIGMIVDAIGQAIDKAQKLDQATQGLTETARNIDTIMSSTGGQSLEEFSNSQLEWQAEYAKRMASTFGDVNATGAAAKAYVDQIEQIKASWQGTESEYQRLKIAVDGYNDATGSSIEITNKQTGELNQSTDELRKNADAWLANAKAHAAQELYEEGYKKQLELEQKLKGVPEQIASLKAAAEEAADANDSTLANMYLQQAAVLEQQYGPMQRELDALIASNRNLANTMVESRMEYEVLNQTVDDFRNKLSETSGAVDEFNVRASELGLGPEEFAAKLSEAGVSASLFSTITREEFDRIRAEANGDIDAIIQSIAALDHSRAYPTVELNDQATRALERIKGRLAEINDTQVTATANAVVNYFGKFGRHARGGLFGDAISAIPRNAAGGINGIVTRPTLTNVGWVGEAGDEAILHMKNAGGAIIPLSNRQHVRPFAQAVASEVQPYSSDAILRELRSIRSNMAQGGISLQVNVEARQWDDYEDVGRRVGEAAAYELRMQGVCA